jgi:hypothetical protein
VPLAIDIIEVFGGTTVPIRFGYRFEELAAVHFCHHVVAHWHVSRLFFFLLSTRLFVLSVLVNLPFLNFDTFIYWFTILHIQTNLLGVTELAASRPYIEKLKKS